MASPDTPTRHHSFSNLDHACSTPNTIQHSPTAKRSRRSFSVRSIPSSVSPKTPSARDSLGFDVPDDLAGIKGDLNGLENLADELAEAWDDECSRAIQLGGHTTNGEHGSPNIRSEHRQRAEENGYDMGISMPNVSDHRAKPNRSSSRPKQPLYRTGSHASIYDGSDYGENSDLEDVEGISASLEHHLAVIETLACRAAKSDGSGADTTVMRVAESLKDLASSTGVETGVSRVDESDEILTLIVATLELVPQLNARSISAIHNLHSSTAKLISTLSVLADNLHMLRQTTSLASRRLKAAKEAVHELRLEAGAREEGIQWVERGNWNRRLSSRECRTICKDVVGGFEEVCEQWEKSIGEDFTNSGPLEVAAG
ncbi:MAG: hypothetical protein Q9209_007694 [Squamulea sp. 1 TL-2023]